MRPNPRRFLAPVVFTLGLLLAVTMISAQEPTLEETLKFGLRARRPVEFQFVAKVAQLTESGQLPRDYVLASFDYSRKRRPKFPMPYFEFVIRRKAEELDVPLDVPSTLTN